MQHSQLLPLAHESYTAQSLARLQFLPHALHSKTRYKARTWGDGDQTRRAYSRCGYLHFWVRPFW